MFGKGNAAKKELENAMNEIQINLENNYKDLAIKAYSDAKALMEKYKADGSLKDRDLKKLSERMDAYSKRMEGYKSQSGKVL
ncbi:MAG: hypothetical protein IKO61_11295 [Lachnospiraceae bacterium]|nr:hypothetical protein [Lachnospiraceae bacterium]